MRVLSVGSVSVAAALLLGAAACSSSPAPASGTTSTRNPNLLTQQEVSTSNAANAYELVERLRPQWLRAGGVASIRVDQSSGSMMQGGQSVMQGVVVYLDNVKLGNVQTLRTVSSSGIVSMRFLSADRARSTFPDIGSDPISGVIQVLTR